MREKQRENGEIEKEREKETDRQTRMRNSSMSPS